ncbi:MAG TPA: hypothetical protein VLZ12_08575 [Verrucomicrobiae bacterium]|nr:hypothetical protein [Verrucomicrobiae bacterium]
MSEQPQHDWLEDALRQDPLYINDDGFTARVVATLPRRRKRVWLRGTILVGMAALGWVIALFVLPGEQFVSESMLKLVTARSLSLSLLPPLVLIASVFGAVFALVASEK